MLLAILLLLLLLVEGHLLSVKILRGLPISELLTGQLRRCVLARRLVKAVDILNELLI